jgi:hypothetical protein
MSPSVAQLRTAQVKNIGDAVATPRRLVRRGSDVVLDVPKWAWLGWFPSPGVSIMIGVDGVGKTTLACHLAAAWTRGQLGEKTRVHLALQEDDLATVTAPRLVAMEADMDRVSFPATPEGWSFPRDLAAFGEMLEQEQPGVVVLDPLDYHVEALGSQVGRKTLGQIGALASTHGASLIFVHHFTKTGKTVDTAIAGGRGVKGVARSIAVLGFPPDADRYDEDVVALAHHKSSYGEREPSIVFARRRVAHPVDPRKRVPTLTEIGQADYTPDDLLPKGGSRGWRRQTAREVILAMLTKEPVTSSALEEAVLNDGMTTRATYLRARQELAAEARIETYQKRRQWWWRMTEREEA